MSTIKASNIQNGSSSSVNIALNTDGSATFAQVPGTPHSFLRNRIINGAMMIDQRNSGSAFTLGAGLTYTLDRWLAGRGTSSTATAQYSTVAPSDFSSSLLYTVGTGASPAAADYALIGQLIEGLNVYDLSWGTSAAKAVTLSFRVRSSVTGTYGIVLQNASQTTPYATTYTINVANTWETKTITIPGPTTGTWLTTNGVGIQVLFDMGVGSNQSIAASSSWQSGNYIGVSGVTKIVATAGATFYLTGVQFETGSIATPFERRLFPVEFALCQRYYQSTPGTLAYGINSGSITFQYNPPVYFRATPTASLTSSSPYWESAAWQSVGSLTSATVDGGHLATSGGDIKINGTFSPTPTYGSFSLFGGSSVRLSAEL